MDLDYGEMGGRLHFTDLQYDEWQRYTVYATNDATTH
jgi:hypothetical protein